MKNSFFVFAASIAIMWFGLTGCATQNYVKEQINQALETRIQEAETQIEANQTQIARLKETSEEQNEQLHQLSRATEQGFTLGEEALERAVEASKVAEGKLLYEVVLTDGDVHFGFDKSDLSEEAKAALDAFAERLTLENENVYIEIQGHTDNVGAEEYNLGLGKARASAVYSYLHREHGIPLHRMDTFSYGESRPIAENNNSTNRALNRRVTLVVIE